MQDMNRMNLEQLRDHIAKSQKKGLPFMCASLVIWSLILTVTLLGLPQDKENLLVFCCSCPLMPLAWVVGKVLKVDIFDKSNPLGNAGLTFTCTQLLYILIVMWVFSAVPGKMVMVYAMVFGAHLLPFSWLYQSLSYRIFAIVIPVAALAVGCVFSATAVAAVVLGLEGLLVICLFAEIKKVR